MDELTKLLVRTVIIYFILTISMRVMGKRQLGEMELSELVTTLLLSEIAAVPIIDFRIPLKRALIPVLLIISFEIIIPFISEKKRFIKKLIVGKPSYIIYKGELRLSEIKKSRISLDELVGELRGQGYFDITDIEYAILEPNGRLSVLPKSNDSVNQNVCGMVHNLIINGETIDFNLKLLGLDEKWLDKRLSSMGVKLKEVSLFGIDDCGNAVSVISHNKKNSKIIKTQQNSKKKNP